MSKRTRFLLFAAALLLVPAAVYAANNCTTIQDGVLLTSTGELITPGYDVWGYNYQARQFNGDYCGAYRNAPWCQPYVGIELSMKWNFGWLSNDDCDGDGLLDRHYGYPSYVNSGAWLTNHMRGTYEIDTRKCEWTDFVKIVAVPDDAVLTDGVWYDAAGNELGQMIWSDFAIIQEIYNDPCGGFNGVLAKGVRPGLGNWDRPDLVE